MFSVNLLPLSEKKAVRLEEMRRMTVFFTALTLCVFAVGFVLLLPSLLAACRVVSEVSLPRDSQGAGARHDETRLTIVGIRDARAVIGEISAYGAEAPRASALLARFFAPGAGIAVRSFVVREDGQLTLAGFASARADLLRFEEMLRSSNRFYEITFPLSNITRERDIQFSFQGKLKQEYGL